MRTQVRKKAAKANKPIEAQVPARPTVLSFRTKKAIISKDELKRFWTQVICGAGVEMRDKLKASELLGKSLAMFTEIIDVKDDRQKLAAALINEKSKRENADTC